MRLKSISIDYGSFLSEKKKTFHFQFPRLTVFIGSNDSLFHFMFSLIEHSIPKWESVLEIENEDGRTEFLNNKLGYSGIHSYNYDYENEETGRLFLEDLTACDLDIEEKNKLGKYLNYSKNQIIIATHCPLIINWLSDEVAKESIFYVYDKQDGLGNTEIVATRFFDIPSMAKKLTVMGPGEVLVDTDLKAIEKQLEEGLWK